MRDIEQLQVNGVAIRPDIKTKSVLIERNSPTEIVLRQRLIQRTRFIGRNGKDVSASPKTLLMTVRWWMHKEPDGWKLHDSEVLRATEIDRE